MGKRRTAFYNLLERVMALLEYYCIPYYVNYSFNGGHSCYIKCLGIQVRVSDHGDRRGKDFLFNLRTYRGEAEVARELLLLRKTIRKYKLL